VAAQAELVGRWMLVGFVHGVMNTDNMTISGETIDYGPCAFLEAFDLATVFSSIDEQGRYAYGNQPAIASGTSPGSPRRCCPLLHDEQEQASTWPCAVAGRFAARYDAAWSRGMRAKLGCRRARRRGRRPLVVDLLACCRATRLDHTSFLRGLGGAPAVTPSRCAAPSWTWPASTPGPSAGAPSGPTPTRWTASTRSTSPATTSSRRRWRPRPPATCPADALLDAVARPVRERAGLCATPSRGRRTSATAPSAAPERQV
jgi:uncharacterized protein YdiU (UPF0061 family)